MTETTEKPTTTKPDQIPPPQVPVTPKRQVLLHWIVFVGGTALIFAGAAYFL